MDLKRKLVLEEIISGNGFNKIKREYVKIINQNNVNIASTIKRWWEKINRKEFKLLAAKFKFTYHNKI
jgi:hypothetical protein